MQSEPVTVTYQRQKQQIRAVSEPGDEELGFLGDFRDFAAVIWSHPVHSGHGERHELFDYRKLYTAAGSGDRIRRHKGIKVYICLRPDRNGFREVQYIFHDPPRNLKISEVIIDFTRHSGFGGLYCRFGKCHGSAAFKNITWKIGAVFQVVNESFKFKFDMVRHSHTRDFGK